MVDGVNKTGGPIEGQKFSQKGVKLSELKGNAPLFNYFKSKGLDENSFVYETDIKELLSKADKNADGEFSRKEVKKGLGLEGSRKELKAAAKILTSIQNTDLPDLGEEGLYPTRVNDNKTLYYDKKGTLTAQYVTDGDNKLFEQYENGNPQLVNYREVSDGTHSTTTQTQFDKEGRPIKKQSVNEKNEVLENRELSYKDGKLAATTDHIDGKTIKTNYDDQGREVRVETRAGNANTVVENEYKGDKLAKQTTTGAPEQLRAGVKAETVEFGDDGKAVKRTNVKADGTVEEFEVKDGKEVPVQKPVTKENLDAGSKTKVLNAANPKGTIEGEVTKMERDEKTKEIKSFTLKSAASGNEFKYTYDPKTKHFVDQTGTKFYAMKDDGTLERNNKLNRPGGGGSNIVLKEDVDKAKNKALAQAYAKDDLKTGDDEIKKAQNKRIEADVKAGKIPGFTYDADNNKIMSGTDEKTIDDVRNHIQAQKDAVKAEQKEKSEKAKNQALAQAYAKDDLQTGDDDIKKAQNKRIEADVKAGKIPGFTYDANTKKIMSGSDEKTIDDVRTHIQAQKDAVKTERTEKSDKAKNKALAASYANVDLKTGDDELKKTQNKRIEADVKAGKIPGYKYDAEAKKIVDNDGDEADIADIRDHIQAQKDAAKAERAETVDKAKMKGIVTKYARIDLTTSDADKIKEQEAMILDDVKKGKIPGFEYDETTKKITQTYTDSADNTVKTKEVTVSEVREFIRAEKSRYVIKK